MIKSLNPRPKSVTWSYGLAVAELLLAGWRDWC